MSVATLVAFSLGSCVAEDRRLLREAGRNGVCCLPEYPISTARGLDIIFPRSVWLIMRRDTRCWRVARYIDTVRSWSG